MNPWFYIVSVRAFAAIALGLVIAFLGIPPLPAAITGVAFFAISLAATA